jgi:hypothetical protein
MEKAIISIRNLWGRLNKGIRGQAGIFFSSKTLFLFEF